jgi:hypothetical protein
MADKITAADYVAMTQADTKADKGRVRGTKRICVQGIMFDSTREGKRFAYLRNLERAGIIVDLKLQVEYELHGRDGPILTPTGRVMIYKADFVYFDKRINAQVVEDSKGHPTDTFIMKRAILAAQGVEVVTT